MAFSLSSFFCTAYCLHDADWAGSIDDRKSTISYYIFLGTNHIFWSSKKQCTVARSSTEAEYRGVANAATEVVWLQWLLRELGVPQSPLIVLCDNLGATYLSVNLIRHPRSKHVEIDIHFVRDYVANGVLNVRFVSTKNQLADVFTKPLSSLRFSMLKNKLSVLLNPLRLQGVVRDINDNTWLMWNMKKPLIKSIRSYNLSIIIGTYETHAPCVSFSFSINVSYCLS